mmetsp:Transcript_26911/g.52748  ORF Transcript_26911/g.52748 Transcript_26911/m.52748 type:complete len:740 (+) Transcript_26911:119-2338(+)
MKPPLAYPPSDGQSPNQEVQFPARDLDVLNFRMLSTVEAPMPKRFFMPGVLPISLLRIRIIFTELVKQAEDERKKLLRRLPLAEQESKRDQVPTEAFQRAFERLLFLIEDPTGFDSSEFDADSDGWISWREFFFVYRKKNIQIKVSWCERIFLTFDDPDSSYLAQIVSLVVLLTIIVSSATFILGTLPQCQIQDPEYSEPKAVKALEVIEEVCLGLFCVEYLARLLTVWNVRLEIFDEQSVLDTVVGFDPLYRRLRFMRLLRFVFTPSNLIDLAAILPGLLSQFISNGEGFVVLRLIRLTRIFRAFKSPALQEPVAVLYITLTQSTKALYVLVFNLLLGIVIFGSLMYLAEGQDRWNEDTQVFERKTGLTWDTESRQWEDVYEASPFRSIPDTFWWAMVTATTVGYGELSNTATTPYGKIVAVITMLFSLVILALPVGVIGGTFSTVWDDYKTGRKNAARNTEVEMHYITKEIQRLDPARLNKLMLIEVWHEKEGDGDLNDRPDDSKYMGEAILRLELPHDKEVTKTYKVRLNSNPEVGQRTVTGSIVVKYEWKPGSTDPKARAASPDSQDDGRVVQWASSFQLSGQLKVTLVQADRLVNLDFSSRYGGPNPFCTVLCHPMSPQDGCHREVIWRSPSVKHTCNPKWDASHTFDFRWHMTKEQATRFQDCMELSSRPQTASKTKLEQVAHTIKEIGEGLIEVRKDMYSLSTRLDQLAATRPGKVMAVTANKAAVSVEHLR